MSKLNFNNYILIALIALSIGAPVSATSTCNPATGKPNGAECTFIDCECASDVCVNGTCVECVLDSDCESGHCIENSCH